MTRSKPNSVDEYLAGFPDHTQQVLKQLRAAIKKEVPEAAETISYAIPAFTLQGRPLIYFAAFKHHVSLYPAPRENEAFKEELSGYKGGKGTVQFPLQEPLPWELIARIVQFRLLEHAQKSKKKKAVGKTADQ